MKTGDKIKALRKSMNLTQTELGEKVGVKKNAVSKWERGRVEEIPTSTVKMLAAIFGVAPSYLIDDSVTTSYPDNLLPIPATKLRPELGAIACGQPILAEQNIEQYIKVPDWVECDFVLRCKGDSMIGARIFDGDAVCIRQQPEVENGEIAAVMIDGEATLKRIRIYKDHVVLEPENPDYRPMVFWDADMDKVQIIGKATYFISKVI